MEGKLVPQAKYYRNFRRKSIGLRPIQITRSYILEIFDVLREPSFREKVGIIASEMFVGGSVGQGTAIPGHYDLDLVIYSRSIDYQKAAADGYSDLLEKLQDYMKEELSDDYTEEGRTHVAIKFRYKTIQVDLLLSPYWETMDSYLRDIRTIQPPFKRLTFSVSVSKYQIQFVQKKGGRVRELITRAKAWRNVKWKDDDNGKPKSYLISLLIIKAYHNVGEVMQKTKKFKTLATEVAEEMKELVEMIATTEDLHMIIPGTDPMVEDSDLLPCRPRIIDPVNPANNMYLSGVGPNKCRGEKRWEPFQRKISTFEITTTATEIMKDM